MSDIILETRDLTKHSGGDRADKNRRGTGAPSRLGLPRKNTWP